MPRKRRVQTWAEVRAAMLWPLLQMLGLVFFSWINATRFDATELKMLGEFAVWWKMLTSLQSRLEG